MHKTQLVHMDTSYVLIDTHSKADTHKCKAHMSTQSTHYSAHPVFMETHDTWTHIKATVSIHGNTVTCTACIQYTWILMNTQESYTGHTDIIHTCTKYASVHGFMDSHGPMYT